MKPRIYADTSVIGGCLDDEWRDHSNALMERFKSGRAIIVISELTLAELSLAPENVRRVLDDVPASSREDLEFTREASDLADEYLRAGVIRPKSLEDARHIATATIHRVDVLVSWNFKHIVNLQRIHGYNSVNLRLGYPLIEIRSPREVLNDDEEVE